VDRDDAESPPVQPTDLDMSRRRWCGCGSRRAKIGNLDETFRKNNSVRSMRSGRFVLTKFAIVSITSADGDARWIARMKRKNVLDLGILQLFELCVRELKAVS